ncbi:Cell division control protein 11, partial [Coemansia sp. RSA 2599]
MLVAGRRGVGKSSFLQTLCDSFHTFQIESLVEGDKIMFEYDDENPVCAEEILDPFCIFDSVSGTRRIRRCRALLRDHGHRRPLLVELIDTPGIDSHDDVKATATINEIAALIERRLQDTLDDELRPRRENSFKSAHIHAVVYVVPPPVYTSFDTDSHCHRPNAGVDILSEIDVQAIHKLGRYTNVIVAVGKCDTIEMAERKLFKNGEFFSDVHELVMPTTLFDFSDVPNTREESPDEVNKIRLQIIDRMPFFLCGSKHVEDWQQMRLPEYESTSMSRISVADWRILSSDFNRICSSLAMITEGIFRDRRQSEEPQTPTQRIREQQRQRQREAAAAAISSSIQSMSMRSDTVTVRRMGHKREISLVRHFGWGTLQINNPDHCDFALLVDILFHSFRQSLVCWCDRVFYEKYRMQRIAADPAYGQITRELTDYLETEQLNRNAPKPVKHKPKQLHFSEARSRRNTSSTINELRKGLRRLTVAVTEPLSSESVKLHDQQQQQQQQQQNALESSVSKSPIEPCPESPSTAVFARNEQESKTPHRSSVATTLATIAASCNPLHSLKRIPDTSAGEKQP